MRAVHSAVWNRAVKRDRKEPVLHPQRVEILWESIFFFFLLCGVACAVGEKMENVDDGRKRKRQ